MLYLGAELVIALPYGSVACWNGITCPASCGVYGEQPLKYWDGVVKDKKLNCNNTGQQS